MEIRLAQPSDIGSLIDFNQAMALETEGKTLDPAAIRAGVSAVLDDEQKGFYVVAEENDAIVGGLMVTYEWSDWRNAWFWWIQSVYVTPPFRGKSIYTRLYAFVKETAASAGNVCGFRLYVENSNDRAKTVYLREGMHPSHYEMFEEQN